MIFEARENCIESLRSEWQPQELELERYLVSREDEASDARIFDRSVFGEELLLLKEQALTKQGKRADLIALDRRGNGVFIELKKRAAKQGVEIQALQYLANYAHLKGEKFLQHFKDKKAAIDSFLADYSIHNLNQQSRIILVARSFDSSLFSMGEWLASQGVAFRCIEYTPFEIEKRKFLSFSVRFDRSRDPLYQLTHEERAPQCFWHNIGFPVREAVHLPALNEWWQYLQQEDMVSASFANQPGDDGDRILNSYIGQDTIYAYASGYGAVGWGVVESPSYELVDRTKDKFSRGGLHLHRLKGIRWKNVTQSVAEAIPPSELKDKYGLAHPIQTRSRISVIHADALMKDMKSQFGPA